MDSSIEQRLLSRLNVIRSSDNPGPLLDDLMEDLSVADEALSKFLSLELDRERVAAEARLEAAFHDARGTGLSVEDIAIKIGEWSK